MPPLNKSLCQSLLDISAHLAANAGQEVRLVLQVGHWAVQAIERSVEPEAPAPVSKVVATWRLPFSWFPLVPPSIDLSPQGLPATIAALRDEQSAAYVHVRQCLDEPEVSPLQDLAANLEGPVKIEKPAPRQPESLLEALTKFRLPRPA
jgi:hypothetical protein